MKLTNITACFLVAWSCADKAAGNEPQHVSPFSKAVRAAKGAKRKGKKLRVVVGSAAAKALGIK